MKAASSLRICKTMYNNGSYLLLIVKTKLKSFEISCENSCIEISSTLL